MNRPELISAIEKVLKYPLFPSTTNHPHVCFPDFDRAGDARSATCMGVPATRPSFAARSELRF